VVAAAVAAYVAIAHPFAGPLPGGWETHHEKNVAATLAVPEEYQPTLPDRSRDKGHWITYTDWSGSIWITLTLDRKAEDAGHDIADSAAAEMYDDDAKFKQQGDYDLDMPSGKDTRTDPDGNATFHDRKAAGNTITYTTDDSNNPRPRAVRIFYYKTSKGDMYKLTVGYPGKGDFTERGKEVAKTAIANLDVDNL
ncbi:serine/threonine protein kinase, partial [Streptomyces carpinensis]